MRRRARSVVWLSAVALALAGCGKEEATSPNNPSGGAPPNTSAGSPSAPAPVLITTADLDNVVAAPKKYRLVLVVKTRNNPFFDPMIQAFEAEAKALGCDFETQAPPQETDAEKQSAMVETITAKGADAILIAPADSKSIVPALKRAQEKGILVVNLDNRVDKSAADQQGLELGGYVGADNEEGGKLAGQAMLEALKSTGKVAVLEGIRGTDNAEARKHGFEQAVQGKLEVVAKDSAEWDTQKAYSKFQAMLAAHPELNGLFCANDNMALGALKALQEGGKQGKVAVVGYDNIADVQPYLKSGAMVATIEQHPDLMGKYGARMAVGVLSGSVPKGKEYLVTLEVKKKPVTNGVAR
jgi:ribose transport system substrate-binding protein